MSCSYSSVTVKVFLRTLNAGSDGNGVLDDIMRVRILESTCRLEPGSILITVRIATLIVYSAMRLTNPARLAAARMEITSPSAVAVASCKVS